MLFFDDVDLGDLGDNLMPCPPGQVSAYNWLNQPGPGQCMAPASIPSNFSACPGGKVFSPSAHACVSPVCPVGTFYDSFYSVCSPMQAPPSTDPATLPPCPQGFIAIWTRGPTDDVARESCIPACAAGQLWDPVARVCLTPAPPVVCPTCPPPTVCPTPQYTPCTLGTGFPGIKINGACYPMPCPSGIRDPISGQCVGAWPKRTCPSGLMSSTSGTCVPAIACPAGSLYDTARKMCIPTPARPSCPTGQAWSTVSFTCVPLYPPPKVCASGQLLDTQTGTCRSPTCPTCPPTSCSPPPSCPSGSAWDTAAHTCVPVYGAPILCPEGQTLDTRTGLCVLPDTDKLWFWGMLGGVGFVGGAMAIAAAWK